MTDRHLDALKQLLASGATGRMQAHQADALRAAISDVQTLGARLDALGKRAEAAEATLSALRTAAVGLLYPDGLCLACDRQRGQPHRDYCGMADLMGQEKEGVKP